MTDVATLAKADSALKLRKLGVFLGAEVTGIELTRPVAPAIVTAIGAALASHEVLVFPRQTIGSDDLKRFGRYFGELTVHPFSTNAADSPELSNHCVRSNRYSKRPLEIAKPTLYSLSRKR